MELAIVQAVKKLNSISREGFNFRRRPILCTTLYRNLTQASNFGGTFDQHFLCIFNAIFTEDASVLFLYHCAEKSKMTNHSNEGVLPIELSKIGLCKVLRTRFPLWIDILNRISFRFRFSFLSFFVCACLTFVPVASLYFGSPNFVPRFTFS